MKKGPKDSPPKAESALINGCKSGDPSCWQKLYERHRTDAWRILYRVVGSTDDLEDLVQKVFMKVYKSLRSFEGRSRFSTWLYRICIHVAMDDIRRKKRNREHADSASLDLVENKQAGPLETLEHREAAIQLNEALSRMKEQKRTVLVLHDIMEVATEEIASSMGIPPATVRTRLFYARRELAGRLAKRRDRRRS